MTSEQDIENIHSNDKSYNDLIYAEMLHDIRDGNQTHPNVNKREARCKIRNRIKQRKLEWKGPLKATQSTGKGLHKVFSTVVKDISQELTVLGESGSEVSHFIPEPKKFAEVTKFSENIKKPWLKATRKEINNIVNNQTFLIFDQNEGESVTSCMDVYKSRIQSDRSLDKLKLRIVIKGDLQNKEMEEGNI